MGSRRCGLIDRVGQGRDVGNGLGDGKSLSGGAGKVASRPVVLNGIMSWGTTAPAGAITTVPERSKVMREEENGKV